MSNGSSSLLFGVPNRRENFHQKKYRQGDQKCKKQRWVQHSRNKNVQWEKGGDRREKNYIEELKIAHQACLLRYEPAPLASALSTFSPNAVRFNQSLWPRLAQVQPADAPSRGPVQHRGPCRCASYV